MDTNRMLDDLAALRETLREYQNTAQQMIDAAIPNDIRTAVDLIRQEYTVEISSLTQEIENLEADIKEAAIREGATVRGQYLMAVFNSGRVSWDDKGLAGYALAHPEIATFRKVGAPSVTIRAR